jgi:hypothetical protein
MRSAHYGFPLSIKGVPGHDRKKREKRKREKERAKKRGEQKGKKNTREANLEFLERSMESYKIYIL